MRTKEKRKIKARIKKRRRIRKRIHGTPERPRLSVFRTTRHIYAQVIDDVSGSTLAAASTLTAAIRGQIKYGGNAEAAKAVGTKLAEVALERGVSMVVFDRGIHPYHGRVRALAEAAREGGLQF